MVTQLPQAIDYPDSDGQPMADNTKQFRWIVVIKENLERLFSDDPNVFVAGDLFWYPVEGKNKLRVSPDTMVVFGRPKGDRGSYQQWKEDNIPPQVVFEILSPGNQPKEMERKLLFYDRYGVEEYYLYDPDTNQLKGWLRQDDFLSAIEDLTNWTSPRLGIRFDPTANPLEIYHPNSDRFVGFIELDDQLQQERQRADRLAEKLRELGINPEDL